MKLLIVLLLFIGLSITVVQAQEITPIAPLSTTRVEERIMLLENQLKEERDNDRLANRIELFINAMGVIATIMFGLFAGFGLFLNWNINRTRDEADKLLNLIRGVVTESEKMHVKSKQDSDSMLRQADTTIKSLNNGLQQLSTILKQAEGKNESLEKIVQGARQSVADWGKSRNQYIGSADYIGRVSLSPSASPRTVQLGKGAVFVPANVSGVFEDLEQTDGGLRLKVEEATKKK